MGRHTGGQKGTTMLYATCPRCGRLVPGGRVRERTGYWVNLRAHKILGTHPGRPWCLKPGERCEAEMVR